MTEPKASQELVASKTAEATHHYALKNYSVAADLYSQATALQAELNGEMALKNADLLYAYGRCLYHVAIRKSDVLGGKVAGSSGEEPRGKKRKKSTADDDEEQVTKASDETATLAVAERPEDARPAKKRDTKEDSKPYFQIEGDDADWDSDESGADEDGPEGEGADGGAADEEDDDFAIAYEVLDIARILLSRNLEALATSAGTSTSTSSNPDTGKGKGNLKDAPSSPFSESRRIQELLADTYDLQAEISLENERFSDAATDAKASLALKQALYPRDYSSIIAEAHFKVSLALEFAAKTTTEKTDELAPASGADVEGVDEEMRRESARHMELAIESTRLRMQREEQELGTTAEEGGEEERDRRRRGIEDVKDMLADMEQRLTDLRAPTLTLNAAIASTSGNGPSAADLEPLRGILGSLLGEDPAAARARIDEATRGATDLTSMVRHKKAPATTTTAPSTTAQQKQQAAAPRTPAQPRKTELVLGSPPAASAASNVSARGGRRRGGAGAQANGRRAADAKNTNGSEEDELA